MTGNTARTELIISGHGGQGVLELANYVSYHAMMTGHHVAFTPSYGPESRGGKVKSYVVFSDTEIDSPIAEEPDFLIVMNIPSMDFVPQLKKGGALLMNSSLIPNSPGREDIRVFKLPATEIADRMKQEGLGGDLQDTRIVANSVVFGAYLAINGELLESKIIDAVFRHFLTGRKAIYAATNWEATKLGFEFATRQFGLVASPPIVK